ncbi:MAG TPA: hypothetical protein VHM69_02655 [Rubrobacter sp.]|nr:hypothetical protein [Rubrobacter sp.]
MCTVTVFTLVFRLAPSLKDRIVASAGICVFAGKRRMRRVPTSGMIAVLLKGQQRMFVSVI